MSTLLHEDTVASSIQNQRYTTELQPNDVLLGRGIPIISHHGNVLFRQLVKGYKNQYSVQRRHQDKNAVVDEIINVVETKYGGRFLRQVKTSHEAYSLGIEHGMMAWVIVGNVEKVKKVKQTLRDPTFTTMTNNAEVKEENILKEDQNEISLDVDRSTHDIVEVVSETIPQKTSSQSLVTTEPRCACMSSASGEYPNNHTSTQEANLNSMRIAPDVFSLRFTNPIACSTVTVACSDSRKRSVESNDPVESLCYDYFQNQQNVQLNPQQSYLRDIDVMGILRNDVAFQKINSANHKHFMSQQVSQLITSLQAQHHLQQSNAYNYHNTGTCHRFSQYQNLAPKSSSTVTSENLKSQHWGMPLALPQRLLPSSYPISSLSSNSTDFKILKHILHQKFGQSRNLERASVNQHDKRISTLVQSNLVNEHHNILSKNSDEFDRKARLNSNIFHSPLQVDTEESQTTLHAPILSSIYELSKKQKKRCYDEHNKNGPPVRTTLFSQVEKSPSRSLSLGSQCKVSFNILVPETYEGQHYQTQQNEQENYDKHPQSK